MTDYLVYPDGTIEPPIDEHRLSIPPDPVLTELRAIRAELKQLSDFLRRTTTGRTMLGDDFLP